MDEPTSNPEREKLLKPMRDSGWEFVDYTKNGENEIWIKRSERKIFLYSIDDKEIIGPYYVKEESH